MSQNQKSSRSSNPSKPSKIHRILGVQIVVRKIQSIFLRRRKCNLRKTLFFVLQKPSVFESFLGHKNNVFIGIKNRSLQTSGLCHRNPWFRGPENQRFSRAPNPKGLRDLVNIFLCIKNRRFFKIC